MASTKAKGPKKSAFVEELLGRNPETNMKAINAAWKKAGHTGTISNPLFYKVKSEMKNPGTRQTADGASAGKVGSPTRSGTSTKKGGQKKSEFVRQLLGSKPDVNLKALNEAWKNGGNPGTISSTLLYLIKSKLQGTTKKSSGKKATAGKAASAKPIPTKTKKGRPAALEINGQSAPTGSKGRLLDELEAEVDDLIFKLKGLGGMTEVEEALRKARRLIVRFHG
jgi:hypothetical protein